MLLTDEEALAGGTTISCETTDEFGVDDIYVYCQEHFADWLRVIRVLRVAARCRVFIACLRGSSKEIALSQRASLW